MKHIGYQTVVQADLLSDTPSIYETHILFSEKPLEFDGYSR